MADNLKGLNQIYDPQTGKTAVTWSYKDDNDLDYFILEYYDEIKRKWVPYDKHMGIVRKGSEQKLSEYNPSRPPTPPSEGGGSTTPDVPPDYTLITKEEIIKLLGFMPANKEEIETELAKKETIIEVTRKYNELNNKINKINEKANDYLNKHTQLLADKKEETVTHNLGSMDVVVSIRETKAPYSIVFTTIEIVDENNIKISFKESPIKGEYKVTIIG